MTDAPGAMIGNSFMVASCNLFAAIVDKPLPKKTRPRRGASPEGTLWKKRVANTKPVVGTALNYARRIQALLTDERLDDLVTYKLHEVTATTEGLQIGYEYALFGGAMKPGQDLVKYPHKSAASLFQGKRTQFGVGYVQLDPLHILPDFVLNEYGLGLKWASPPLLGLQVKGPVFGWFTFDLSTRLESVVIDENQGIIDATGLVDYLIPILVWA